MHPRTNPLACLRGWVHSLNWNFLSASSASFLLCVVKLHPKLPSVAIMQCEWPPIIMNHIKDSGWVRKEEEQGTLALLSHCHTCCSVVTDGNGNSEVVNQTDVFWVQCSVWWASQGFLRCKAASKLKWSEVSVSVCDAAGTDRGWEEIDLHSASLPSSTQNSRHWKWKGTFQLISPEKLRLCHWCQWVLSCHVYCVDRIVIVRVIFWLIKLIFCGDLWKTEQCNGTVLTVINCNFSVSCKAWKMQNIYEGRVMCYCLP